MAIVKKDDEKRWHLQLLRHGIGPTYWGVFFQINEAMAGIGERDMYMYVLCQVGMIVYMFYFDEG